MIIETVKISSIKKNPDNPRTINDDKFNKLVKSIKEFPEMLKIRPIVVNDDMMILGGNMRLSACKEAGLKEIHIIKASQLTEEQQKEFIIKDNVGFGEWNWEQLANEWGSEKLNDWGLDVSNFDFSDKNQEIDTEMFADEMIINLKYTESDYQIVKDGLSKIADNPEQAVWQLLGNE